MLTQFHGVNMGQGKLIADSSKLIEERYRVQGIELVVHM